MDSLEIPSVRSYPHECKTRQRSSKLYGTSLGKEFRRQVLFFRSSISAGQF